MITNIHSWSVVLDDVLHAALLRVGFETLLHIQFIMLLNIKHTIGYSATTVDYY